MPEVYLELYNIITKIDQIIQTTFTVLELLEIFFWRFNWRKFAWAPSTDKAPDTDCYVWLCNASSI